MSPEEKADFQEEFVTLLNLIDNVYFKSWNDYFEFIAIFRDKRAIFNEGNLGYSSLYDYLYKLGIMLELKGTTPMMIRLALREKELLLLAE